MILIICAWIYCFLLSSVIGAGFLKVISRIGRHPSKLSYGIFYQFWFGFAILIGMLQMISLLFPLNNIVFLAISLIALLFVLFDLRNFALGTGNFFRRLMSVRGILYFLVVSAILVLASYSANKEVTHTDTFIYHFNAVKWAKEYPAVPGLVNLHNRLGFNSSFFLFAAFTEIGVYTGNSAHTALSFLLTACLIHWFFVLSNPRETMSKRIFCMMTFLFLIIHISFRMDIASLSTDYPMAVFLLVFCLVLLDKLEHKTILLLPLSAVIFSFKLSGMLVVGMSLLLLLGYLFMLKHSDQSPVAKKVEKRMHAISFVVLCFIAAGFIIRNIIISGWLIYPFPIGNLHLPWSVPKEYVLDMIAWIKSYPKIPGGASPETIRDHSFFYWFGQWSDKFRQSFEFTMLAWSICIVLCAGFLVSSFQKFVYARLNLVFLFFISFASIIFWFTSAPDIRFGSIYFYIFFAASVILLFEACRYKPALKVLIYTLFLYLAVREIPAYYVDRKPNLFTFAYTPVPKLNRVVASPPGQTPPLYIYMPAEGNQCGNSPIPCTPYAGGLLHNHQLIKQRVPGDLSKGFLPPGK